MKLREVYFAEVDEAHEFLLAMGVSRGGARLMAEKSMALNILVKGMSCGEANILKQEMLILGGDAAIHKDVITGTAQQSDVLILGNRKQISKLSVRLKEQCFSLPDIGLELKKCLDSSGSVFEFCGETIECGNRTNIMGIVNVTPDSFSEEGRYAEPEHAAAHALSLQDEGADVIDIGGESSRPGAQKVTPQEELDRVIPVLDTLKGKTAVPLSIDTRNAEVARKALETGASIINDITGFADPEMVEAAASSGAGIIIMHMQGEPGTMQDNPRYDNVVEDILSFFEAQADKALKAGVKGRSIMIDPGIGFGKTTANNFEILRRVREFKALGFPVLIGASRKSFIGKSLGLEVDKRLPADIAVTSFCTGQGVDMVRVHDVKENIQARDMALLLAGPSGEDE
ncbi:dihydropteroate synthase [Planctomycetota bacterium]